MRKFFWYTYNWIQGLVGLGLAVLVSIPDRSESLDEYATRLVNAVSYGTTNYAVFPSFEHVVMILCFFTLLGASMLVLSIRVQGYYFSMDIAVVLCSLFLFGPVIAIWITVSALVLRGLTVFRGGGENWSTWLMRLVGNSGNRVLQILLAAWVYTFVGGQIPISWFTANSVNFYSGVHQLVPFQPITYYPGLFEPFRYGWGPPLCVMATFFLVNNLLFIPSEFFYSRSMKQYFFNSLNKDGFIFLTAFPISIIMSGIYTKAGFFSFLLFSILIVGASAVFKVLTDTSEMLERSVVELQALNRVGRAMSSTLDMGRQFEKMYEECRRILAFDTFFIALFNSEKKVFELKYCRENGNLTGDKIIPLGQGFTSMVWETKQPLLMHSLDDQRQHDVELLPDVMDRGKINSLIYVPMIFKDQVTGVVSIQHDDPNAYTEEDMTMMATLANQAAISLSNAQLYETAITESLTKLHSRNYFFSRFDEELKRCNAQHRPIQLILMDIDEFKSINDRQGHLVGDEVLRSTAEVIKSSIPAYAIPSRYGGDEFMVLLPGADRDTALKTAETLLHRIKNNPINFNGMNFSVTVSIGISGIDNHELKTKEKILIDADKGLYKAKTRGKNRIVGFPD